MLLNTTELKVAETRSWSLTQSLLDIKIWKEMPSRLYDYEYIKHLTELMKKYRTENDYQRVMHIIRSHSERNIGNILSPNLYRKSYIGTKSLIEEYQAEVR